MPSLPLVARLARLVPSASGIAARTWRGYIQRRRRKSQSMAPVVASISATIHQNCIPSPPGKTGSVTFIPYMPVSTVSGMKIVDRTVRTFITWLRRVDTLVRCASSRLLSRSWNSIDSSVSRTRWS